MLLVVLREMISKERGVSLSSLNESDREVVVIPGNGGTECAAF